VADDERVIVDQRGLHPAIRADDDAELLTEPGEVEIERAGRDDDEAEGRPVLGGCGPDHRPDLGQRNEIGEEQVRDHGGHADEQRVLADATNNLARRPRSLAQPAAGGRIAVNPAFDPPVNVVEEDCMRAGPPAPDTAEQRGDEKEYEPETADDEEEQPEVLRDKSDAEKVEAPLGDV